MAASGRAVSSSSCAFEDESGLSPRPAWRAKDRRAVHGWVTPGAGPAADRVPFLGPPRISFRLDGAGPR